MSRESSLGGTRVAPLAKATERKKLDQFRNNRFGRWPVVLAEEYVTLGFGQSRNGVSGFGQPGERLVAEVHDRGHRDGCPSGYAV